MKTKRAYLLLPILLLTLCLLFTGCSKSAAGDRNNSSDYLPNQPAGDGDYGYGNTELPDKGDIESDGETLAKKIIRTVYMDAQTKEFDRAINEIRAALYAVNGYEESFRTTGREYGKDTIRRANMTLRIPAEKLDAFLGEVGDLVHVIQQNATLSNVTNEYYDIEARLNVLESQRTAYEEMLKKSTNTNEILNISQKLYDVIEEIEAYKARLRVLDSQVSYSTVTISLVEVIEYTEPPKDDESFIDRITDAFYDSWARFSVSAQSFLVWLVDNLPSILVWVIVICLLIWIIRAPKRRRKKKEAKLAAAAMAASAPAAPASSEKAPKKEDVPAPDKKTEPDEPTAVKENDESTDAQ